MTVSASPDIVNDVLFHSGPPVSAFKNLYCLAYSWVTVNRKVVFGLDEGALFVYVACHHPLTLVIPDVVNFL